MYLRTFAGAALCLAFIPSCTASDPDGMPGEDGQSSLVRVATEPSGSNCATGGQAILTGLDVDGDGALGDDEVEMTVYVCNGAGEDGAPGTPGTPGAPGANGTLLRMEAVEPGDACPAGGYVVLVGVDDDEDGILDAEEITDEAYVCTPPEAEVLGFRLLGRLAAPTGPAAEIISASPDERTLVYSNAVSGLVDFVDIGVPSAPRITDSVDVRSAVSHAGMGDPTSVAITPNGEYAIVAVLDTADPAAANPGALVFVSMEARDIVGSIELGVGPDSVRITPDGSKVLVAIEDEGVTPIARPGAVQVVTIDYADPSASTSTTIPMIPDVGNASSDPQPEFIDITADGATAVVSLQENNVLAVIDLGSLTVSHYIDAGVAAHPGDLVEDDDVDLADAFMGRREPDSVCFLPGSSSFLTANEGDTSLVDGVYPGGRGFTIFDIDGAILNDAGSTLEDLAVLHGQYPDSRSTAKGIEPEGCAAARFGTRDFAFVLGERNSSLTVLDVADPAAPVYVQMLPAPFRPEGAVALPNRNLLAVAGEGDDGLGGGVYIYEGVTRADEVGSLGANVYQATSDALPFGGISAGAWNGVEDQVWATPDNAWRRQRLWTFQLDEASGQMRLVDELLLTDAAGAPLEGYDPEGLSRNPEGGFVIASEGTAKNGGSTDGACDGAPEKRNRLLFFTDDGALDATIDDDGIVDLPCAATGDVNGIDWTTVTSNGFEGAVIVDALPLAPGGLEVVVAFQRPLSGGVDEGNTTRIGVYDVDSGDWRFYFYTLAQNLAGGDANIFLSDIAYLGDDQFVVVERDQRRTGTAAMKRLYSFRLSTGVEGDSAQPVEKVLAADLLATSFRFDFEKVETIAITPSGTYIVNDNDGGEEATLFYRIGPLLAGGEEGGPGEVGSLAGVVLNEVSSNPNPDWVELYNPTGDDVSLAGWYFTDSDDEHVYELPAGTIVAPGGFLTLDGEVDFDFGLGSSDTVRLYNHQGSLVDSYEWTMHVATAGRCLDGTGAFIALTATKNAPNDCPAGSDSGVVINEVSSNPNPDWLELYNPTDAQVSLSGWYFTDDDPSHVYAFPYGTVVEPGAFLVLDQDVHHTFGFGSGDGVNLYNGDGVLVDAYSWGSHVATASRCPDGAGDFVAPTIASKGATNDCS